MLPLAPGQTIPMFALPRVTGALFRRADIRGRAALAILVLPDDMAVSDYLAGLEAHASSWGRSERAIVITRSPLSLETPHLVALHDADGSVSRQLVGTNPGGWLITDRYGQLYAQGVIRSEKDLPEPAELLEWLEWVGMRCSG